MNEVIGKNAGKVWSALHTNGTSAIGTLVNMTKLRRPAIYAAIGWLARENKLDFENDKKDRIIRVMLRKDR